MQTAETMIALVRNAMKNPRDSWRQIARGLLYGASTDRAAKARARVGLAILFFAVTYCVIATRLVMFAALPDSRAAHRGGSGDAMATARPEIHDRNGEVLATDVRVPSLFAEPRRLIDTDEAVELLTADLPDLDAAELRERLASKRGFVWLKRDLTPEQQRQIYRQGLPGIGFLNENKRVYPNGSEVSHVIGHVNIDNQGIAGMEKWLDGNGLAALHMAGLATDRLQTPVELAVDLRVQHALHEELAAAHAKYKTIAAAGVVLDVRTGEIVAMVSEPDYDPNNPRQALDPTRINRLTTGVFEMGSTFKAFTFAMALDFRKGDAQIVIRWARPDAGRPFSDPRFRAGKPDAQRSGMLYLVVEHLRRAHRAVDGRRGAQGVPEKNGPARSAAHGIAGERRTDRAKTLG